MKKILILCLLALSTATTALAQPRAIGVRIGYGLEASYQHAVGKTAFLEADFGVWQRGILGTLAFDFNVASKDRFNFYVGPAVSLGNWRTEALPDDVTDFCAGVGAQIGAEYQFKRPITLSLDWRPTYYFTQDRFDDTHGFYGYSIALGVRYRF